MSNTVYLVRHAEAESNTDPFFVGEASLTAQGVFQSKQLAEKFNNETIMHIYTSSIIRAKLTASEISRVTKASITELPLLKERKGSYSTDRVFVPEESFVDLQKRVKEIKLFLQNHSEGRLVVVSHAIFIKNLLADIMTGECGDESIITKIVDTLVIDNATISKIVFNKEKGKWRIMYSNCVEKF